MFDPKSDYALNKKDREAIVYRDATGTLVRLTVDNFSSEAEFLAWKDLSDADYHEREHAGRGYSDHCVSLIEAKDSAEVSPEDVLVALLTESERRDNSAALSAQLRELLTEKQYRRLCLYYLKGMTEAQIAEAEGVGQRRVSTSILSGRKKVQKFFSKFFADRG